MRLLVGRDPFLVLDLCLDNIDSVWLFDFESDGFTSEHLDEYLHATTKTKDQRGAGKNNVLSKAYQDTKS